LEGLPTNWVFQRYQDVAGTECQYEYQLEELHKELLAEHQRCQQLELERTGNSVWPTSKPRPRNWTRNWPCSKAAPPPLARRAREKVHHALRRQLRAICRQPLHHPKAKAFRKRLLGPERKQFFTCFRRPNVPPTNNQAERSLRPVVIMRKVVLGTRSEHGLENHSVRGNLLRKLSESASKPFRFRDSAFPPSPFLQSFSLQHLAFRLILNVPGTLKMKETVVGTSRFCRGCAKMVVV
jgi:hypothetical protein